MIASAQFLKSPALSTSLPLVNGTTTFSMPLNQGRVAVSLTRSNIDNNLVDAYATGYFYIAASSFLDPLNQQPAQIASVYAKFQITNVAQFMLAVPGSLTLGYGTNASGGIVYASNLAFQSGSGDPTTQVSEAYYYNSVFPTSAPPFVTFSPPGSSAQQLSYPPNFANLDAGVRAQYSSKQTSNPIPSPADFEGVLTCPSDTYVIFVSSSVDFGKLGPVTVSGVCAIYATGDIYIHNNLGPAPGDTTSWVALLSEGIIHLADDAPQSLSVCGNFVTNVAFMADGAPRPTGNLIITGGIVSMQSMGVADVWQGTRTYQYASSTSPNLFLPNISNQLEYRLNSGTKY